MRTIVYIDGFNLFYNLLTKSPYKWLNLVQLFEQNLLKNILLSGEERPTRFELIKLKYFTAPILGSLADDPNSENRQAHYHRALKASSSGKLEIIRGFHLPAVTTGVPVEPVHGLERLKVTVMEEKQTDVNIALHMYRDATQNLYDCLALCSNDSDLEPALAMIREEFPQLTLGLVLPVKANGRKSGKLARHAHWLRHHVQEQELASSQIPDILFDHRNRTIKCPTQWTVTPKI